MEFQYQFSDIVSLDWVIKNMPNYLFPDLAKKKDRFKKRFAGVIATSQKKPVGLILSTFDQNGNSVRVHSFVVHPEHQNKGVGKQLLLTLEQNVSRKGAKKIDGHYRTHWKSVLALEKILSALSWKTPVEDLIIVKGKTQKVLNLFMDSRLRLPEGYDFCHFDQITPADEHFIKEKQQKENWFLDYLDPFVARTSIYNPGSIFLKEGNVIVGWVISHLISPTLNEFTALFIDGSHRPYKLAHLLMREAIHQQDADGVKEFLITSKTDNYVMSRFLLRHAEATEVFLTRTMYTIKLL
jgi:GNAT superfamily N-acetyltransferase